MKTMKPLKGIVSGAKCILSAVLLAAVCYNLYAGGDPERGDVRYTQWGIMDGNAVRTLYSNHAEVARWPDQPSGEWPKGTGHSYVDGVATIIAASAFDTLGNRVHPMSTNYREFIDTDPITKIPWGWAPLQGYSNPNQQYPSRSDDVFTWPVTWPDQPDWTGEWNGYFGRGIMNADLETYFVCDDSPDQEWFFAHDEDTGAGVFYPVNSDLEIISEGNFDGDTPGYFTPEGTSPTAEYLWTNGEQRSGSHSISIEKENPDGIAAWYANFLYYTEPEEIEFDGLEAELGAWIKLENVNINPADNTENIRLVFTAWYENGESLSSTEYSTAVPQTQSIADWMEVGMDAELPAYMVRLGVRLICGENMTGTIYADDFFARLNSGEALPLFNPNVDLPDGWTGAWPEYSMGLPEWQDSPPPFVGITSEDYYNDGHALKMVKEFDDGMMTVRSDPMDFVNDGSALVISAWSRMDLPVGMWELAQMDTLSAPGLSIAWYEYSDNAAGYEILEEVTFYFELEDDPADWHAYEALVMPHEDASMVSIQPTLQTGFLGTVYWDKIKMVKSNPRGGLGMEINARGFQWSHVLAQDVIFWHYEIINESETDYDSVYFSQYIDWGIGGTADSGDDEGGYNTYLDIAFAWDYNGLGQPGEWGPTGVAAYAFLESPGNGLVYDENGSYIPGTGDGLDNDMDGLLDESRNNPAGQWLDTYPYGVDDVDAFIEFFNREPRPHFEGDEDQDWEGFDDLNDDGIWNTGEPLNDDVGKDGLAPYHINYPGPDEGEGDGLPTDGETNFNQTDKDESDQLGLTGFSVFDVHNYELLNDEENWRELFVPTPPPTSDIYLEGGRNLGMFFSSGPFPMKAGQTERFSMALVFAEKDFPDAPNEFEIRNSSLARKKETVQQIYNADYRFAQPPLKPNLTAIAGDGQVILYWDDRSEDSFDPFTKEFDFEGYKIYRSTEPFFFENRTITNTYGEEMLRESIAQWDLANDIEGLHPVDIEGVKYYLGNDSGLRHYYIDQDVLNGVTYYYAVVAYDRGLVGVDSDGNFQIDYQGHARGLSPSECASIIQMDLSGNVETDINTAVATPRSDAAGYIPGSILDVEAAWDTLTSPATGFIDLFVIEPDSLRSGHEYEIRFSEDTNHYNEPVPRLKLTDLTSGEILADSIQISLYGQELEVMDGLGIVVYNDSSVAVVDTACGWAAGHQSNFDVTVNELILGDDLWGEFGDNKLPYPADYLITFESDTAAWDTSMGLTPFINGMSARVALPVPFQIWNLTENKKAKFAVIEREAVQGEGYDRIWQPNESILICVGEDGGDPVLENFMGVDYYNPANFGVAWAVRLFAPSDPTIEPVHPQAGDVIRISSHKPFRQDETLWFRVQGAVIDEDQAEDDMEDVYVVPNPYVATSIFEPSNVYRSGRGERRIYFMNLPEECQIRIYTKTGKLVDTIEHNGMGGDGQESWDLVSKDGMNIAYGVYFYTVEAYDKISTGKFAVIK